MAKLEGKMQNYLKIHFFIFQFALYILQFSMTFNRYFKRLNSYGVFKGRQISPLKSQ